MKKFLLPFIIAIGIAACTTKKNTSSVSAIAPDRQFDSLLEKYYNERMELFPLEATMNGDARFNDLLPADFTDSYRTRIKDFFLQYQSALKKIDRSSLNDNDGKSYDILNYEMKMGLDGLDVNFLGSSALINNSYMPFDQFAGLPLLMGQMGSGTGNQPFKTVTDYDNWLKRASLFGAWSDSAIVYFKKGMAIKYVLPKNIVEKMIPQMQAMIVSDPAKSIFYTPVTLIPASFSVADKNRLDSAFRKLIVTKIVPAYTRLYEFLKTDYLAAARTTTGVNALPGGDRYYRYLVKYWTTTNKSPEEIYDTGLSEVKRIRTEMEKIKQQAGFNGNLNAFFDFMRTDKRFFPFKTPEDVLNGFRKIQATIDPNVKKLFTLTPKTKFEIRQTEAFRAASASIEYYPGLPDGSRPGIFYVPITDATKFNSTSGMESTFLHEAIPGHHYQCSIQSENTSLPKFRRFIWYGAYGEGYALYCESLGKELGLYTDPYQHMGALGDEIHRAIRLVVDVGMHTGKMTREEAIKYSMENEAISEEAAIAEIERYMVYAGQALSYKTGALFIRDLRDKYKAQMGSKFDLASFHAEYLKDGCMPLEIIEKSMDKWSKE